jgi:NADPH:quinone reductase-like Zn-dependent oxidoreductase
MQLSKGKDLTKKIKNGEDEIAVITKPKELKFLPYRYNAIGPDEVLVNLIGCGLDHNDIPLWEGRDWLEYPLPSGLPGREGWGVIEEAGELSPFKAGDLVAVFAPNALASKVICKHDQVHKLPDDFRNIIFPAKAFAFAVNIFDKAKVNKHEVITVLGNGFVSSIICYLIKVNGAIALKVANGKKDDFAEETFNWYELDGLKAENKLLTNDRGCDKIIECTGTSVACDLATSLIKDEGNLILARQPKNNMIKISMEDPCGLNIIYAHDQSLQDYHQGVDKAVRLIREGTLIPEEFISTVYPFKELKEALDALCYDAGEYNKYCISFDA